MVFGCCHTPMNGCTGAARHPPSLPSSPPHDPFALTWYLCCFLGCSQPMLADVNAEPPVVPANHVATEEKEKMRRLAEIERKKIEQKERNADGNAKHLAALAEAEAEKSERIRRETQMDLETQNAEIAAATEAIRDESAINVSTVSTDDDFYDLSSDDEAPASEGNGVASGGAPEQVTKTPDCRPPQAPRPLEDADIGDWEQPSLSQILVEFYEERDPEGLHDIATIQDVAVRYQDKRSELREKLCAKYPSNDSPSKYECEWTFSQDARHPRIAINSPTDPGETMMFPCCDLLPLCPTTPPMRRLRSAVLCRAPLTGRSSAVLYGPLCPLLSHLQVSWRK